ncbi:poly(U)-specific endoribonuclease homolog [Nasonia vitripennis]|uniref:EndoU domain-containing protein n=1 Tax=Nasonia vitripennis TaxID=7425 RepID=A0A7M7G8R8_NASVI|nr:poly(U)-specific endoribonuclease homolog [Nasonia vitripennis]
MKTVYFLIVLLSLSLVVDVDAGWKFWKKKKDDPTSTEDPLSSSTVATPSTTLAAKVTPAPATQKRATTPASANRGIAAAADPALAIGVGNIGGNIREDARNQPRKPNPGTDVGLDISYPKPARPGVGGGSGQGYRDWAADLTGAGEPGRQSPKLPAQGPALSGFGGQQPNQGNRPASVPGTPTGQKPAVVPGSRPASVPGTPTGQQQPAGSRPASVPGTPTGQHQPTGSTRAATPVTQAPTPAARPVTPSPQQRPTVTIPPANHDGFPPLRGSANNSPGGVSPATSPTGGKSWADVAGTGGNSRPGSPTPAPKLASPTPGRGSQQQFDYTKPGNAGTGQSGRPGIAGTGAAVAGGAAIGAAAVGAANSGKTYSSNPTFSKGNTITDDDLEKLSEALFIKDVNNANKYITLNLQKQTTGQSPKDEAPQPLFQVKPEALQISTIQKVLSIYDNYKLDTRENEYISPAQRQEESLLVDTFLSTNVMSMAMRFLADKGFVKKDYYDYKDTLRGMWFNLYSRGEGKIGSAGFEHVFLTELKLGTELSGLHNWIYFNAEELKKRLDYLGYIKKVDLGNKGAIVKAHVKFNGIDKPVTTFFIGTSPELEMALYTVCFFARPDANCPVSLGGTKFNIVTHKFRYRGRDLIGSAYPEI